MQFRLISENQPKGDQPEAIKQLVNGLNDGAKDQVLLGITGSGKTFSIANVIQEAQRPTLILAHNKMLAAHSLLTTHNSLKCLPNCAKIFAQYCENFRNKKVVFPKILPNQN